MSKYKPLAFAPRARIDLALTTDNIYWKRYKMSAALIESSLVEDLCFSPTSSALMAAVCSTNIHIYSVATGERLRTLAHCSRTAHTCAYRLDGALIVVGDQDGDVHLLDAHGTGRAQLRHAHVHEGSIRAVAFSPSTTGTSVWTGSDDRHVHLTRLDAAYAHDDPAARAYTGLGHSDHVRTLGTAHAHDALAYSGAYDQTVRAWDTRVNGGDGATAVMQHAAPVQHLVVMRNDAMVAVANGTLVSIWDLRRTNAPLCTVGAHHKTITRLALAKHGSRLLSTGLDCHIKIYDIVDYSVLHSISTELPVVSFGISPDEKYMATGSSRQHTLTMYTREVADAGHDGHTTTTAKSDATGEKRERTKLKKGTFKLRFFHRRQPDGSRGGETLVTEPEEENRKLSTHVRQMKSMRPALALTKALTTDYIMRQRPEIVVALLKEIHQRQQLATVLAGRGEDSLLPLLKLLQRHLRGSPSFTPVLIVVAHTLCDVYMSTPPIAVANGLVASPVCVAALTKLITFMNDEEMASARLKEVHAHIQRMTAQPVMVVSNIEKEKLGRFAPPSSTDPESTPNSEKRVRRKRKSAA